MHDGYPNRINISVLVMGTGLALLAGSAALAPSHGSKSGASGGCFAAPACRASRVSGALITPVSVRRGHFPVICVLVSHQRASTLNNSIKNTGGVRRSPVADPRPPLTTQPPPPPPSQPNPRRRSNTPPFVNARRRQVLLMAYAYVVYRRRNAGLMGHRPVRRGLVAPSQGGTGRTRSGRERRHRSMCSCRVRGRMMRRGPPPQRIRTSHGASPPIHALSLPPARASPAYACPSLLPPLVSLTRERTHVPPRTLRSSSTPASAPPW
jgi:hypothetical protein